jgi:putative ABC transport system permease protein
MVLLKTIALSLGLAVAASLAVALVVLAIALIRMGGVTVLQWRDVFSLDRWQEVLHTIGRNKLRTFLTTVSVAWGIFVLVFLLGLGRGLDQGMRKTFAKNATNAVWINANKTSVPYAGYDVGRRIMFENADYDRAKVVDGVEHISGQHWIAGRRWGGLVTKYGAKANSFAIEAVHPEAFHLQLHQIIAGRFLTAADIAERRKAAVLGQSAAGFLFEGEPAIGKWINVGSVPFQVVGVFTDPGGAEEERRVYIPVSTAQLAFNGAERLGQLQMTLGDAGPAEAQRIIDHIVGQLAERHDFDPNDRQAVRVHNSIEQFERFRSMFFMISAFVVVIGLGTLAAGVVGVSNIMMIAVKERTKEVGIRKALGATPSSIVFMIIQEAVFLTGIAGLLGLAAGVGLLELVARMEIKMIANPSIDLGVGIGATLFLILAGALAGYFPARAAARVNPIHALRDV